jgi:predicted AAA+ superfamily ATPase
MAVYKAFRVDDGKLKAIKNVLDVTFDDLIGYEEQKKLIKENTLNFIQGKSYNNVLLYGDSGTGKSTSVKALLNEYFDMGLRIIEVYKHQMEEISKIINKLKNRPYYYIIYMDDLSFEENEIEYKYLKSIIEGGIEPKPENVAIYATSNRRHLIKETMADNGGVFDDLHRSETQAEKLSLAYRFGLQIFYSSLSPAQFREMVKELALRNDIKVPLEEVIKEATKWELTYGSLSGRCATQFISYLVNKEV